MGIKQQDDYDEENDSIGWITGEDAKEADRMQGIANFEIAMEEYNKMQDGPGEDDITTVRGINAVLGKKYSCWDCGRFNPESHTCKAFRGTIPVPIIAGGFEHVVPFKGDHGLRWTPVVQGKK